MPVPLRQEKHISQHEWMMDIMIVELEKGVQKMKIPKASGHDEITTQAIKITNKGKKNYWAYLRDI